MKGDIEKQPKIKHVSMFLYKLTERKDTEMAWSDIGVPVVFP